MSFVLIGSTLCFITASLVFQSRPSKTQITLEKGKKWLANKLIFVDSPAPQGIPALEPSNLEVIFDELKNRVNYITSQWEELPRHEKAVWGIIGINSLVFLAWKIPRLQPFMTKHFLHLPSSDRYYTILTSVFSHKEVWHLGFNMMALKGFATNAGHFISAENLVAFYITTGLLSSLGRRLALSAFPLKISLNPLVPSLGASGAIFGIVSFVAYQAPNSQAAILFLPGFNFKLSELLACFMALDLVGILRGWRVFDHYVST